MKGGVGPRDGKESDTGVLTKENYTGNLISSGRV